MDQLTVEFAYRRAVPVAQVARAPDDQVEYRLRIAGRDRHHLQHIDCRGLLFNPLAISAIARSQFGATFIKLPLQISDDLLRIS
jgi:hypothetical protein